jgi:hypothetical protein
VRRSSGSAGFDRLGFDRLSLRFDRLGFDRLGFDRLSLRLDRLSLRGVIHPGRAAAT